MISVHTDGGSRGNPGPAAIGIVLEIHGAKKHIGKFLGVTTNNVAEYTAILESFIYLLKEIAMRDREEICFFLDSQLVQRQLSGIYTIKDARLKMIYTSIKKMEKEWGRGVTFVHVPREQNKEADKVVNETLDQQRATV